jgi:hypothetical protein
MQPLRPGRHTEHRLAAVGVLGRLGPGEVLLVGEVVDVRPGGKPLQRLLVDGHHVGGLDPGDVLGLGATELAQLEKIFGVAPVLQLSGQRAEILQLVREGSEVSVQAADHLDLDLAGPHL